MKYLAIDTSGKHMSIVLRVDDKAYTYYQENCSVKHSVELMPEVENLINNAGVGLKDMDFFAVVVGAGSFTGIRIGVATVKAMCMAFNKPCLSITSFDTLAYNVIDKSNNVLSVIDAGHNGYYACGYKKGKINFQPCYILGDKLKEIMVEYDFILSQTEIEGVKTASVLDGLVKATDALYDNATCNLDLIEPLYCRKSQAEEGRK